MHDNYHWSLCKPTSTTHVQQPQQQKSIQKQQQQEQVNGQCDALVCLALAYSPPKMPQVKTPQVKMPQVKMPQVKMPQVKLPKGTAVYEANSVMPLNLRSNMYRTACHTHLGGTMVAISVRLVVRGKNTATTPLSGSCVVRGWGYDHLPGVSLGVQPSSSLWIVCAGVQDGAHNKHMPPIHTHCACVDTVTHTHTKKNTKKTTTPTQPHTTNTNIPPACSSQS